MSWRRTARVLHRDLGYLSFGLTLVYAVSGVLVNHIHQWNPNYRIERTTAEVGPVPSSEGTDPAAFVLGKVGETGRVKSTFQPDPGTLQIFTEGNTLTVDLASGRVTQEKATERPVWRELNYLHLNHPKRLWTWFADLYAAALAALAVTGIVILPGRTGLRGRGAWLTAAGIAVPLLFLALYRWGPAAGLWTPPPAATQEVHGGGQAREASR